MIVNIVWSAKKRTYHESLRGDGVMGSPNNAFARACARVERILASRNYREVTFYIGIAAIGCDCAERKPTIEGTNFHPWHNDRIALSTAFLDDARQKYFYQVSTDDVTADDLESFHKAVKELLIAEARKGRML